MNLNLTSLFPDLEALTPDGRWNALQDWLAKNPDYGDYVEEWSAQTVEQVFDTICILAVGKYGALAGMVLMSPMVKPKIMRTIELLQACYRERQAYDNQQLGKEIKNGRTRMDDGCKKKKAIGRRSKRATDKAARDRD